MDAERSLIMTMTKTIDIGATHIAYFVKSLEKSIQFYKNYASMEVIHLRETKGTKVAWISDRTRPFVIVLVCHKNPPIRKTLFTFLTKVFTPTSHLGVALESKIEVDRLSEIAQNEGCLKSNPKDTGPPVGYYSILIDPDGNLLELSYGQQVELSFELK